VAGWREANEHGYTAEAAYWRARGAVRSHLLPRGAVVKFARFSEDGVHLQEQGGAEVMLTGEVLESSGKFRPMKWRLALRFDDQRDEWSMVPATEGAPP
jgi:hypothetical protein